MGLLVCFWWNVPKTPFLVVFLGNFINKNIDIPNYNVELF